jgi:two-component system, OmpR family, response regulator ChvI
MLLVDDEADVCRAYQTVLQDVRYECDSSTYSVKAMQEFRPNYYEVIILDIKTSAVNGFELCKKIREADKSIHLIFLTACEEYYEEFRKQSYPGK